MSARATCGDLDYNRILEQNPSVRVGSPIVLVPKTDRSTQRRRLMPSATPGINITPEVDTQSTQRQRLQPSATPGFDVIRDIDQDPARLLVFVVSGFVLRHFLRCGRCHFTTHVFTSHARDLLWRLGGVHIHRHDLESLIFRLEHATQTLGYNVAAVTVFDRRFCDVWRSTREFLLDPPKPAFEAFHQGRVTWPDLSTFWKNLADDIAASEDGQRFNVAALNEELHRRLPECRYSRLPSPLLDAPSFSGYRQTPPLPMQVSLPSRTHTQSIVRPLATPQSTSGDTTPSSSSVRRQLPSRPARRIAQMAVARAAVVEADLTEREDSEDRRLVEEDEAVPSIEKSPQISQKTVKRKREEDPRRPGAAAAIPSQDSTAGPSGSNRQPMSPSQGSGVEKPPRKRYKCKARREFYVRSPQPAEPFVPNTGPTPTPPIGEAAPTEINSDAGIIAGLARQFADNQEGVVLGRETIEAVADQFRYSTGGRDPPELETVEEIVLAALPFRDQSVPPNDENPDSESTATDEDVQAQIRAEDDARAEVEVEAQIKAEAEAAAAQVQAKVAVAKAKVEEAKAKAEPETKAKAASDAAAAAKARRDVKAAINREVPARRALKDAEANAEERRRQMVARIAQRSQEEAAALRAEAEKGAVEREMRKRRAEAEAAAEAERESKAKVEAEARRREKQERKAQQEAKAKAEAEAAETAQAEEKEKRRQRLARQTQKTQERAAARRAKREAKKEAKRERKRKAEAEAEAKAEAEAEAEAEAKARAEAAEAARASHAAVQQHTPSDSDCDSDSDSDSDSDHSAYEESSCGESSSDESSSDESSDESASRPSSPEPTPVVLRINNGTFDREVMQIRVRVAQETVRQGQSLLEQLTRSEQRRR